MNDDEKRFGERLTDIESKLNRVLYILESDDKTNSKGLVETVMSNKEKIDNINRENDILRAKASTWGVIGGAIITACVWFFKLILTKSL